MRSSPVKNVMQHSRTLIGEPTTHNEYSTMVKRPNASYERRQQDKREKMMASSHPHVMEIIVKQVACPSHILQVKHSLDNINNHEALRVESDSQAVIADLVAACHQWGHKVETAFTQGAEYLYITKNPNEVS